MLLQLRENPIAVEILCMGMTNHCYKTEIIQALANADASNLDKIIMAAHIFLREYLNPIKLTL